MKKEYDHQFESWHIDIGDGYEESVIISATVRSMEDDDYDIKIESVGNPGITFVFYLLTDRDQELIINKLWQLESHYAVKEYDQTGAWKPPRTVKGF